MQSIVFSISQTTLMGGKCFREHFIQRVLLPLLCPVRLLDRVTWRQQHARSPAPITDPPRCAPAPPQRTFHQRHFFFGTIMRLENFFHYRLTTVNTSKKPRGNLAKHGVGVLMLRNAQTAKAEHVVHASPLSSSSQGPESSSSQSPEDK